MFASLKISAIFFPKIFLLSIERIHRLVAFDPRLLKMKTTMEFFSTEVT